MQKIAGHDPGCDPVSQGGKHLARPPASIDQRAVRDIGSQSGEDLVLALQWQVVIKLGDQHMGQ
jgi:hypothetical protein